MPQDSAGRSDEVGRHLVSTLVVGVQDGEESGVAGGQRLEGEAAVGGPLRQVGAEP